MQTIFPVLRYNDARQAIQWLCDAFGFHTVFSVPKEGDSVRYAQLKLGTNIIMLGSVRNESEGIASPIDIGVATQALCVYIKDVDAHYAVANAANAEIISPPENTDFRAREYHARDLEGHVWIFTNFLPTVIDY